MDNIKGGGLQFFLIGHRGTGKTSLLQRLQIYSRGSLVVFDLDREIEKALQQPISNLFSAIGENAFREIEKQQLEKLIENNPNMICALGAGFDLGHFVFPKEAQLVWIRRESDRSSRIFLDRPRLDESLSHQEEYQQRYQKREALYSEHADWTYLLPEGLSGPCEHEKAIWGNHLDQLGGFLTLLPGHLRHPKVFLGRLRYYGVDAFELRSDLLSIDEMKFVDQAIADEKKMVSIRNEKISSEWQDLISRAAWRDWPLELGQEPPSWANCISSHQPFSANETLTAWAERLSRYEQPDLQIKWSPEVFNFEDIELGLRWQNQKPEQRNFLPRSASGRWGWVRLYQKQRQKINFIRDGVGSSADQPTLHQWLRNFPSYKGFAAVLGTPIAHSYSPIEHLIFARRRQIPFYNIEINESEFHSALSVLKKQGLCFAAVTSPLKTHASSICQSFSFEAQKLASINTLSRTTVGFRGHNTDLHGFAEMLDLSQITNENQIVVWGGGGTLAVVKSLLPSASFYSARLGEPRVGSSQIESPEVLIWAAAPGAEPPQKNWQPRFVLDLNYCENSRAREFAINSGARYFSGLHMFQAQAEAQQQEWDEYVK